MTHWYECECGQEVRPSWLDMGEHFGFPPCCITFFVGGAVLMDVAGEGFDAPASSFDGTGFVPCPLHRAIAETDGRQFVVDEINEFRMCGRPFAVQKEDA